MDFSGWEKLSLVDYDDNITTTLFAAGCNFRCPFCHNGSLVLHPQDAPKIAWEDIVDYLQRRKTVVDAVCISGGEPTLMNDLLDKMTQIKSMGYLLKLDTNGSNPSVVKKAVSLGLIDYIAMDIKNEQAKYAMNIGTTNFDMDKIIETASFLISGTLPYEFRTTLIDEYHTETDMERIGSWLEGAKKYFLQHYIDNDNCIAHGLHMVSKEKALIFKAILERSIDFVALRSYD